MDHLKCCFISSEIDVLFKALANCWGMLFIIAVLGFSLVDVPRKIFRKTNPELEIRHNHLKIKRRIEQLDELEIMIEFKLESCKKEIVGLKDDYRKKKFDDLIGNLPFQIGNHTDFECGKPLTLEKITIDDIEQNIYQYIKTKYKLRRNIKTTQSLLKSFKSLKVRSSFFERLSGFYYQCLYLAVLALSGFVVLLIILNGFDIERMFLQSWLKKLSFWQFDFVFYLYAAFVGSLIVNGILKSKFQNFKGLNADQNTDVQSIIYFSRSVKKKHSKNGNSFLF